MAAPHVGPITAAAIVLGALVAYSTPVNAQAGWYLTGGLSLTAEFDNNIFGRASGRESDFINRTTLQLVGGYESAPLTLLARYAVGSELYAEHSELNGLANQHDAGLDLRYLPTRNLTLSVIGRYTLSDRTTPFSVQEGGPVGGGPGGTGVSEPVAEPSVAPTVEVGRGQTTQFRVSPSLSYALGPRTSGSLGYTFTTTEFSDSSEVVHSAETSLSHQLTRVDRGILSYRFSRFDSSDAESLTTHTATLGWSHSLTAQTEISLEAGPRFSNDDLGLEAAARLSHRFRRALASLAYSRSQQIVVGRTGAQNTDSVSANLNFEVARDLQVGLRGTFMRAEAAAAPSTEASAAGAGAESDVYVYTVGADLTYELSRRTRLFAAYRFSLEEGDERITHHVVTVGLVFSMPILGR